MSLTEKDTKAYQGTLDVENILADFFLKKLEMRSSKSDYDEERQRKSKHKKHKKSKHKLKTKSRSSTPTGATIDRKVDVERVFSSEEKDIKRLKKIKNIETRDNKVGPYLPSLHTTQKESLKNLTCPVSSTSCDIDVPYGPSLELLLTGSEVNKKKIESGTVLPPNHEIGEASSKEKSDSDEKGVILSVANVNEMNTNLEIQNHVNPTGKNLLNEDVESTSYTTSKGSIKDLEANKQNVVKEAPKNLDTKCIEKSTYSYSRSRSRSKSKTRKGSKSKSTRRSRSRSVSISEKSELRYDSHRRRSYSRDRSHLKRRMRSGSRQKRRSRSRHKRRSRSRSIRKRRSRSRSRNIRRSRSLSRESRRRNKKLSSRSRSKSIKRSRSKSKESIKRSKKHSSRSRSRSVKRSRSKSIERSNKIKRSTRSRSRSLKGSRSKSKETSSKSKHSIRSRSRSMKRSRSKSKESSQRSKKHSSRSRSKSIKRSRSKSKESSKRSKKRSSRSRSRSIKRSRSKSKESSKRSKKRSSKSRSRSVERSRSKSKELNKRSKRHLSRDRSRSAHRYQGRRRSRSYSRDRYRSKHTSRGKNSRYRSRSRSREYSDSRSRRESSPSSRSHSKKDVSPSSRSKSKRSRSKSKEKNSSSVKSNKIDQAKILQIAQKNVLTMIEKGTLPEGLSLDSFKKEQLVSMKSGGKSVQELTDFCTKLSEKENEPNEETKPNSTNEANNQDGDTDFIHHPFKLKEQPMIKLNIKNAVQIPIKTHAEKFAETAKLSSQFPVSSGNQHKQKELEWIPVVPDKSKTVQNASELKPVVTSASKTEALTQETVKSETTIPSSVSSTKSISHIPLPVPALAPPPLPPLLPPPMPSPLLLATTTPVSYQNDPTTNVYTAPTPTVSYPTPACSNPFPVVPSDPILPLTDTGLTSNNSSSEIVTTFKPTKHFDISSIVTKRFKALTKLQEDANDTSALQTLHEAQSSIQEWVESQQVPGLFTGSTDAKLLTVEELCGPKHWNYRVKRDIFTRAAPVTEGKGMSLLKKMGWNPGEGLGKNKEGSLEPLVLDIKTDKKGLVSMGEGGKKATASVVKELQGKHPVSALMELCSKRKWKPPLYSIVKDQGPPHKKIFLFKVEVNGVDYLPATPSPNKKIAKADAAVVCLQALNVFPK